MTLHELIKLFKFNACHVWLEVVEGEKLLWYPRMDYSSEILVDF